MWVSMRRNNAIVSSCESMRACPAFICVSTYQAHRNCAVGSPFKVGFVVAADAVLGIRRSQAQTWSRKPGLAIARIP